MKKKLTQITTDYRLIAGYIIAFILLLTSYFISLYSNRELVKQMESVTQTNGIMTDLESLMSLQKDGETGVRGFMNTRDSVYLEPFYKSLPGTEILIQKLENESQNSEGRSFTMGKIVELINRKYGNIEFSIQYFSSHHYIMDTILIRNIYEGKAIMDNLRFLVNDMQSKERNLLEIKSKKLETRSRSFNIIVTISLALAFIFVFFGIITFVKETRIRKLASQKIEGYQEELKKRVDELDGANKELVEMRREEKLASAGRIVRVIGHEVRNPLTNIDLALNQIQEEINNNKEPGEIDTLFNIAKRNSERIDQLITELLNTTGTSDLNFSKIPMNTLMEDSLVLANDRIELNKITVQKAFADEALHVSVDTDKMKTAFLNIIINAIEAMKDGKDAVLTVTTMKEKNKCIVVVMDNGVGIDKPALDRLFEPFYTTKTKGTGLGLAHTHNIIMNHKASIDVESKPGTGTSFIMKFDLLTDNENV